MQLTTDTFQRPGDLSGRDDPRALYARSYLHIRMVIGLMGVMLPTLLFLLDWVLLGGPASLRGSLSAYYHSAARDLFVGGLTVTGFFLITYMSGQKTTWDYWLSTVAGVAALGVAFLPTERPNLEANDLVCGAVAQMPFGCTQLQQALGERTVAAAHYAFAATFILALAMLCFVFAKREARHNKSLGKARLHRACGVIILVAVAWIAVGETLDLNVLGVEPLYIGEVVSVYSFGASWLAKAQDLLKLIFTKA